jgi:hypothetical protein
MAGKKVSRDEFIATIKWGLAVAKWTNFGDSRDIRKLQADGIRSEYGRRNLEAIENGTAKRKRGRPPKMRRGPYPLTDEDVVQLVWIQKYRFGLKGSNNQGGPECNERFVAVANNHGVDASEIHKRWRRVPKARRDEIGHWVKKVHAEAGYLHPKHQDE